MKVVVLQENLEKGLLTLQHIISQKTQLPILSHVLLKSIKDSLIISATDLEIGAQVNLGVKVEEEGEIAIPAKLFYDLTSTLPHDKITLVSDKQTLNLQTTGVKSSLLGMDSSEFPKIFEEEKEEIGKMRKSILMEIVKKVCFAASGDEGRPALTGVLIQTGEELTIVATDGYRLSMKKVSDGIFKNNLGNFLIPVRIFKQIPLFLSGDGKDEDVVFYLSKTKKQLIVEVNENIIVGRLIEGDFPDYERIIPKTKNTTVEIESDQFVKAVKSCAIFARESANIIKMKIDKDLIVFSANSPQVGENTVTLEANVSGEENEIAFNSRFLLEMFSNIDAKELVFEMTGPLAPGVFKIKDDDSSFHIIMPVRIQAEASE